MKKQEEITNQCKVTIMDVLKSNTFNDSIKGLFKEFMSLTITLSIINLVIVGIMIYSIGINVNTFVFSIELLYYPILGGGLEAMILLSIDLYKLYIEEFKVLELKKLVNNVKMHIEEA